ncbi:four helix bundle protein [Candidatus Peribacteria bacterium]|nr:four helix bundle protein [Candidatus Peribacteria bacterium]
MTPSHKFEDMEIWQEARLLVREVRSICRHPNVRKDFTFIDQITRAARSIMYNVAEGAEAQTNPEFIQFLGYAKRSAGEVRAQLYDALDEQYIDQETFRKLKELTEKLGRMIGGFIRYLSARPSFRNS